MLKKAKDLLKKEQFDEAQRLISRVAAAQPSGWGLFEDSPEKLQRELIKVRTRKDREKSLKLMVEARKLFNAGQYKEAKKLALEAKSLHGPYGVLDFVS